MQPRGKKAPRGGIKARVVSDHRCLCPAVPRRTLSAPDRWTTLPSSPPVCARALAALLLAPGYITHSHLRSSSLNTPHQHFLNIYLINLLTAEENPSSTTRLKYEKMLSNQTHTQTHSYSQPKNHTQAGNTSFQLCVSFLPRYAVLCARCSCASGETDGVLGEGGGVLPGSLIGAQISLKATSCLRLEVGRDEDHVT